MANSTDLYSYQGQEPQPLPNEIGWVNSDGTYQSKTGIDSFTDEDLVNAGYTGPFTRPEYNYEIETQEWNIKKQNWVTKPVSDEIFWKMFIEQRNYKLFISDRTQLADAPLTSAKKTEWATYRKALRDLPATTEDPKNVIWPIMPE